MTRRKNIRVWKKGKRVKSLNRPKVVSRGGYRL